MAMVVLLLGGDASIPLGPSAVAQLSRIGVTHLSIFRDDEAVTVVLEGWAFRPAESAKAIAAMGADLATTRTLHAVAQLAVEVSGWEEEGQTWSAEQRTAPDLVTGSAAVAPSDHLTTSGPLSLTVEARRTNEDLVG